MDPTCWTARRDIAEKGIQTTLLPKKISIVNMRDNTKEVTKAFLESEDGQKLILDSKFYGAQAERVRSKEENLDQKKFPKAPDTYRKSRGTKSTEGR